MIKGHNALLVILVALATSVMAIPEIEVQALYHESVNFTCEPSQPNSTVHERVIWILPTGEILAAGMTGHPRVDVLQGGFMVQVRDVDDADFGTYNCLVVFTEGRYLLSRHGLNLGGPYYGDLFALRYRNMLITGAVAAAVCFVTMGSFCFLYNRQQARLDAQAEQDRATRDALEALALQMEETDSPQQKGATQYSNSAFVIESPEEAGNGNGHTPGSVELETRYAPHADEASGRVAKPPFTPTAAVVELGTVRDNDADYDGDVIGRTKL